jgi:hypothetical protein
MMIVSFSTRTAESGLGLAMSPFAQVRPMSAIAAVRSIAFALVGFLLGLLLAAVALPIAAKAAPPAGQTAPAPAPTPPPVDNDAKTVSVVVYGNDPCPQGKNDEIVVCAREPESERYRIPKRFRGKKQDAAPGNSWANKTRSTEDASRMAAGLPDTCSAIGSGGQTGCFHQFQVQSMQQRRQQKEQQADNPDGIPQD